MLEEAIVQVKTVLKICIKCLKGDPSLNLSSLMLDAARILLV